MAALVKIRADKQLLSHFKVLLDVDFASGAARVRRILPMMAVLVQICNVFPGLRIMVWMVCWHFKDRFLIPQQYLGVQERGDCLPSVCWRLHFIVILSLILWRYLFCTGDEV